MCCDVMVRLSVYVYIYTHVRKNNRVVFGVRKNERTKELYKKKNTFCFFVMGMNGGEEQPTLKGVLEP